jgi:hypothetical protein
VELEAAERTALLSLHLMRGPLVHHHHHHRRRRRHWHLFFRNRP